jgi:hypothetical protein
VLDDKILTFVLADSIFRQLSAHQSRMINLLAQNLKASHAEALSLAVQTYVARKK